MIKNTLLCIFIISYLWGPLLPKIAGLWIHEYLVVLVFLSLFAINKKYDIKKFILGTAVLVLSLIMGFGRGTPSFELANWGGVAIALALHSSNRMQSGSRISLYIGVFGIYLLLYISTNKFENFLWKNILIGEEYSINIFGRLILSAYIFTFIVKDAFNRILLLTSLLVLNTIAVLFVDSRQLYILLPFIAFSIIQMLADKTRQGVISIIIIFLLYYRTEIEILYTAVLEERGFDSLRTSIYSCFIQNIDVYSMMLGGYESSSGKCGTDIVGVRYLHSIYLEAFTHLGLIGYILAVVSLLSLFYVWQEKNYKQVTIFVCILSYGLVESIGVWALFYIALYPLMLNQINYQIFKQNSRGLRVN